MERAAASARGDRPATAAVWLRDCLVALRRRAAWRLVVAGGGLVVMAVAGGVAPWTAVLVAAVTLLALALEVRTGRGDARALQVAVRAARVEGQRDAVAQVMSLELAHERSRSVLEALREGVLVVDASGEVVLANPAARRAMRRTDVDPAGKPLWEVLAPELAARAREAWLALADPVRSPSEIPQIRYSGIPCRDAVYDLTAVEAKSARTGQDFGCVFLLVDATRAHELQRLKDSFLSSVSHELRTPLTNICAYAELLAAMTPGAAEWPEFVRVIHEEGLQLSRLIDAMFDYLQLESGEAVFAAERVDGRDVVRSVLARFVVVAAERCQTVAVDLADDVPALEGDRARLAQVVCHLLDNALKFTPRGGRIRVGLGPRDGRWELRVEDSGPGVPPGDRRAVFEKFVQLCDPLTDKPPGTGLGLATSRAIVARLGGLIWCEDAALGGAAFVVLLPAVDQPRLAAIAAGTGAGGGF
jgi:signal transduction histidine kinase